MPDIESMEIIGDDRGPVAPPLPGAVRRVPWVAVLVAVVGVGCLTAIVVLAAMLHAERERRPPEPTEAQRAAVSAVLAWASAVDRHDAAALDAALVADAGVLIVGPEGIQDQLFRDRAFLEGGRPSYPPDLRLEVLGTPQAVQDLQVTLTMRLSYQGRSSTAQTVVDLERRVSGVKVAVVVMTTAPTGKLPSEG
jgi:hypothetical protein